MKLKYYLILLLFIVTFTLNSIENSAADSLNNCPAFKPIVHISLGLGYTTIGNIGTRFNLKFQNDKLIYAFNFSSYSALRFGEIPYYKGALLNQQDIGVSLNKIILPPGNYQNSHISLGTGVAAIFRNVRDERISYENWTSKTNTYIGIPLDANISFLFKKTHLLLNLGYRGILYKRGYYNNFVLDLGFWFD